MPNVDPKLPCGDSSRHEPYPNKVDWATPSLQALIAGLGEVGFPKFVEMALYDAEQGYYSKSDGQVGRSGDFYTSVSVGSLFGRLLARRFAGGWEAAERPVAWRILEIGAHGGKLAADILSELQQISPDAWKALEYTIVEPLPRFRLIQELRLQPLARTLRIVADASELTEDPLPGFAFGNEILDALPFHLVEMRDGEWRELYVSMYGGGLALVPREIGGNIRLMRCLEGLGNDFPEGYRTEIRTNFGELIVTLAQALTGGTILFADYGFAAPEYYNRLRSTGTLRTFSRHKAGEDPLDSPGARDITAHVDFTSLTEAARESRYFPSVFTSQGNYLIHLAKPLILEGGLSDAKSIAQFQSLTHPAHLGSSFHVIELEYDGTTPPDVRHRLAL